MNRLFKVESLLVVALVIALFHRLGEMPLVFEEPRRTEVAIEMMLNDNYIVPTLNDTHYYNKPPVYNWALVMAFKVFGSFSELAARSVTVMSVLLLGFVTLIFGRKYFNNPIGWLSMMFVMTTGDLIYRFSFIAEIDVFYAVIVAVQGMAIFHFWRKGNLYQLFIWSYIFCAIGFLTKGLTSPVFQVVTLITWALFLDKIRSLFSLAHLGGILVFLAITGGYFLLYAQHNDAVIFITKLLSESSQKTISTALSSDILFKWLKFPLMVLGVLLPWGLFLGVPNKSSWKRIWSNEALRFCCLFIISNILVYWISPGTRPRYLFPFLPFAMVLIAWIVVNLTEGSKRGKLILFVFGAALGVAALGTLVSPAFDLPPEINSPWLLALVGGGLLAGSTFAYFKTEHKMVSLLAGLVILRFIFNSVVFPVRKADVTGREDFKAIAMDIAESAQGARVWLYSPKAGKTLNPAFFGVKFPSLEHEEIVWPPYQISFYLAAETGQVLSWSDRTLKGNLFLADVSHISMSEIEWIRRYPLQTRSKEYILFRFADPDQAPVE